MFARIKLKAREKESPGAPEYLVVGLGNPGARYEDTRHNAGFMAADALAAKYGCKLDRLKFKSLCGTAVIDGKKVLILKPSTFMNLSGEAVRDAAAFYKLPMDRVLVLFDDVSLPPGKLRIRRKGSDGGHNGIKNIIYLTGNDDFPRVKIGVGAKPHPDYDLAAWVLSRFSQAERQELKTALEDSVKAVELIVSGKLDEAMNRFN